MVIADDAMPCVLVVLRAKLCVHCNTNTLDESCVPCCSKAKRLWKAGAGKAAVIRSKPSGTLSPPNVRCNAESINRWRRAIASCSTLGHLRNLLIEGKAIDEIAYAIVN